MNTDATTLILSRLTTFDARHKALTAVHLKITAFTDVRQCKVVTTYQRFDKTLVTTYQRFDKT